MLSFFVTLHGLYIQDRRHWIVDQVLGKRPQATVLRRGPTQPCVLRGSCGGGRRRGGVNRQGGGELKAITQLVQKDMGTGEH